MTESVEDFAALLARVRQGDESAVAPIVERYEAIIRRAARGMLGQPMRPYLDSIDVVQSVHRSLLIGLRHEKFDISTPDKLIALALTLVRRKVARHWRRIKRQATARADGTVGGERSGTLEGVAGTPADPAEMVGQSDALDHLLKELDPVDRQLIELRLQGHSTAEVARIMQVDSRFLRVRLGRLRKRLREQGLFDEWL